MTTEIRIDVSDWEEEALRTEEVPENRDELIGLALDKGYSARQAAEWYIAPRAGEHCPLDLMAGDKELLSDGGSMSMHMMIAQCKRRIELNGREREVRAATAIIQAEQDNTDNGDGMDAESLLPERGYVKVGTEASLENATRYLKRYVPGHIWNRLLEIALAGGDVRLAAGELICKVQEFVDRLTEEPNAG